MMPKYQYDFITDPQMDPKLANKTPFVNEVASFIYEMPVTIVAAAIAGVVSIILFPPAALPCFGLVGAAILSRLVVKHYDHYNPTELLDVKEKCWNFNKKYPTISVVIFIFATVIGLITPAGGFVVAAGLGIYRGIIIQIDIYEYRRKLREEENKMK